jgi:hypothetical protein
MLAVYALYDRNIQPQLADEQALKFMAQHVVQKGSRRGAVPANVATAMHDEHWLLFVNKLRTELEDLAK